MRIVAAILLTLTVLSGSFREAVIFTVFKANQAYIAANLCENRTVPESSCQGGCFLKKQLKEAHEEEQQLPSSSRQELPIVFYVPAASHFQWATLSALTVERTFHCRPDEMKGLQDANRLLRPPQC